MPRLSCEYKYYLNKQSAPTSKYGLEFYDQSIIFRVPRHGSRTALGKLRTLIFVRYNRECRNEKESFLIEVLVRTRTTPFL